MGNVDSALQGIEHEDQNEDFDFYVMEQRIRHYVEGGEDTRILDAMIRDYQILPTSTSSGVAFNRGYYEMVLHLMTNYNVYPENVIYGTGKFEDPNLRAEALQFLADNTSEAQIFTDNTDILYHGVAVWGAISARIDPLIWAQEMNINLDGVAEILIDYIAKDDNIYYNTQAYIEILGWLITYYDSTNLDPNYLRELDARLYVLWQEKN